MNITPLSPLEQRAARAYEVWVDVGDNRYGSLHREAFMTAYELGWTGGSKDMYDTMVKEGLKK